MEWQKKVYVQNDTFDQKLNKKSIGLAHYSHRSTNLDPQWHNLSILILHMSPLYETSFWTLHEWKWNWENKTDKMNKKGS
jgi:hypothetical protein